MTKPNTADLEAYGGGSWSYGWGVMAEAICLPQLGGIARPFLLLLPSLKAGISVGAITAGLIVINLDHLSFE